MISLQSSSHSWTVTEETFTAGVDLVSSRIMSDCGDSKRFHSSPKMTNTHASLQSHETINLDRTSININSNKDQLTFNIDEQQKIDLADSTEEEHTDTALDEQQEITVPDNADNQDHNENDQKMANGDSDNFRAPLNINKLPNGKFLSAREIFQFINKNW